MEEIGFIAISAQSGSSSTRIRSGSVGEEVLVSRAGCWSSFWWLSVRKDAGVLEREVEERASVYGKYNV